MDGMHSILDREWMCGDNLSSLFSSEGLINCIYGVPFVFGGIIMCNVMQANVMDVHILTN